MPIHCFKKKILEKKFDLNDRLIAFSVSIIKIATGLPKNFAANSIARQLVRSGTSPTLNYGEAQSAESRNDFIHKLKISVKELRETYNCLKIIRELAWISEKELIHVLDENNQLISIFVKSIETAKNNGSIKK